MTDRASALPVAAEHAQRWLDSLADRPVPPQAQVEEIVERLGTALPDGSADPAEVVEQLAAACEPGLTAMPSGRFFGLVIGGTPPGRAGRRLAGQRLGPERRPARGSPRPPPPSRRSPSAWLLDLLGLPDGSAVGFVTGGTMANFTCLAAGRDAVLRRAGWDVPSAGLVGSPGGAGAGRARSGTTPSTWRCATSASAPRAGGAPTTRAGIDAARPRGGAGRGDGRPDRSSACRRATCTPARFDPFAEAIAVAHGHGAWVHVDGAFGLFAGAPPRRTRHLVDGRRGRRLVGHRRAQDPQRPLRLRDRDRARPGGARGRDGDARRLPDPGRRAATRSTRCRSSRRRASLPRLGGAALRSAAREWPTWSSGLCAHAARVRRRDRGDPGAEVLNDVVFTQVCARFGDDERTARGRRAAARGRRGVDDRLALARPGGAAISVTTGRPTEGDVRRSLRALERAAGA